MILAVDPGSMCGYIVVTIDGYTYAHDESTPFHMLEQAWSMCKSADLSLIVVERFNIDLRTGKMTRQYDALETIGALRYIATRFGVDFQLQNRAEKSRITPMMLKNLHWWKSTPGGHANDAARHAAAAFVRNFPKSEVVKRMLGTILVPPSIEGVNDVGAESDGRTDESRSSGLARTDRP